MVTNPLTNLTPGSRAPGVLADSSAPSPLVQGRGEKRAHREPIAEGRRAVLSRGHNLVVPTAKEVAEIAGQACVSGDENAIHELLRISDVHPELVRKAIAFDFSALPGAKTTLEDYEHSLAKLTDPATARATFQELAEHAQRLKKTGRDRIVFVSNNPWGGGGVSSLVTAQGRLAALLGLNLEWHRLHATHADTASIPRELYTAMHFGMRDPSFDVRAEMRPWLDDAGRTYKLLRTVAHDPRVALVSLEDHQVAPLIPKFVDARHLAKNDPRIMWRCHFDTLAHRHAVENGNRDAPIVDFWHEAVGRFVRELGSNDVAAFQQGSVVRDPHAVAPLAVLSPGVDPLEPRNTPLTASELEEHLREVERDHGIKLPRKNTFVTGGRFVPQKGMAMVMRAFAVAAKEDPEANLVVFGPKPSGDPIKDRYFDQLMRLHHSLPEDVRDRVFIVTGYNDVRRFYQLAAGHADGGGHAPLPAVFMSFAEGYNLMVDEAVVTQCPVLSTTAIKRMADVESLGPWTVELRDLGVPDPDGHYTFSDPRSASNPTPSGEAKEIEQRLARSMGQLLRMRREDPAAYAQAAEANRETLGAFAGAHSVPNHLLQYLRIASAEEPSQLEVVRAAQ